MRLLVTCAVLLCAGLLSCEQPTDPAPQAATEESTEEPETVKEPEPASEPVDEPEQPETEEAPEPEPEPEPEPDPEPEPREEPPQEPEPVEEPGEPAEPEPSPWEPGWIYLVDVEDEVHYSAAEPDAQLRAAYYDMAAKWNRQEREGYPFRVEEGR